MIALENVGLSFGRRELFRDLCWQILPGMRVGLIGDNGAGKTTLLRMLVGEIEPEVGRVHRLKGLCIRYLAQDFSYSSSAPLLEVVLEGAADVLSLRRELELAQEQLATFAPESAEHEAWLQRFSRLQEQFEHLRGFQIESDARAILAGLGFDDAQMLLGLDQFSGGWQMRAAMARLLLSTPDLLLLDEPTNHLDEDTVEWLERYLRRYAGAVIVVSHDRFFLDRVVSQISELSALGLRHYPGNYSQFAVRKEEDRERLRSEKAQQDRRTGEIERFIERFRYKASKARQVQSRVRSLEKVERIEVDEEAGSIGFRFPPCERSGEIVVALEGVGHRYGDLPVFSGVDIEIERGEKVALVGPNGAGKSTLSRILMGVETPTSGQRRYGQKVEIACYTQEFEREMDWSRSALQELHALGMESNERTLRTILGCFGFSGSDVDKKIGVLSGGEKSRVAVAKLLLMRANFLILDEPTNHLDIKSKNILQDAIQGFQGTALFVSHDRYFLDGLATRVLELRNGRLRNHLGDYSFYLRSREDDAAPAAAPTAAADVKSRQRGDKKRATQEKMRRNRVMRDCQKAVEALEREVHTVETRLTELEGKLCSEGLLADRAALGVLQIEHGTLRKRRDALYADWERAAAELEATRAALERGEL